jgi:hypothetical protein
MVFYGLIAVARKNVLFRDRFFLQPPVPVFRISELIFKKRYTGLLRGSDDQGQICPINPISSKKSIGNQIVIVSLIRIVRITVSGHVRATPLINGPMST